MVVAAAAAVVVVAVVADMLEYSNQSAVVMLAVPADASDQVLVLHLLAYASPTSSRGTGSKASVCDIHRWQFVEAQSY